MVACSLFDLTQCTCIVSITLTLERVHSINASAIATAVDSLTFVNVCLTPPSNETAVEGAHIDIHFINTVPVLSTDHIQTVVMIRNKEVTHAVFPLTKSVTIQVMLPATKLIVHTSKTSA